MPAKPLKTALLAMLVTTTGLWCGIVCARLEAAAQFLSPPFGQLTRLFPWLLLLLLLVMVAWGLASSLLQDWRVAAATCTLSGLALLAGWGWSGPGVGFSMLYMLAGFAQIKLTRRELEQRLRFSVRAIAAHGRLTATVLTLVLAGSFYLGLSEQVRGDGFSIPDGQMNRFTGDIASQVVDSTPLSGVDVLREEAALQVRNVLKQRLNSLVGRVQHLIPPAAAALLFVGLVAAGWLLSWVAMLLLYAIFQTMKMVDLVQVAVETREAERLVLS
jgi:hypothetical protein